LPGFWIHPQNPAKPVGNNPDFSIVPLGTVTATSIVGRPQRDLEMADELRVHVRLKKPLRVSVRAHPNASIAISHPAGVP
jgi:hypothetical protein